MTFRNSPHNGPGFTPGSSPYGFPGPASSAGSSGLPARPGNSQLNRGDSRNYNRSGRIRSGAMFAIGYLVVIWAVFIVDFAVFGGSLGYFGIRPLDFSGLWGIFTAPFLHANLEHLISNSIPGAVFCFLIGLSGKKAWWEVTIICLLIAGIGTWLLGGPGTNHIGASGLVYGWLAYLIVRGVFNRSMRQILLGVVLGVMYSGLIWGVLPLVEGVSWQGHLFGAIGGVLAGMTITSDDPVKQLKPSRTNQIGY